MHASDYGAEVARACWRKRVNSVAIFISKLFGAIATLFVRIRSAGSVAQTYKVLPLCRLVPWERTAPVGITIPSAISFGNGTLPFCDIGLKLP